MKHTQPRTLQFDEVIVLTCDARHTRYDDPIEIQGFIHLKKTGNYSFVFGDGNATYASIA